jgi:hypothetical protein
MFEEFLGTLSANSLAMLLLKAKNRTFNSDGIKFKALIKVVVFPLPATALTTAFPVPLVMKS